MENIVDDYVNEITDNDDFKKLIEPEFYTCYATKADYIHNLVSNRLFIMVYKLLNLSICRILV